DVDKLLKTLELRGILGGYPIDDESLTNQKGIRLIWCATEVNTKEEIDTIIQILGEVENL
ncbi:MAG TPA: hypothetical protein VJ888_06225, partial [Mobilitalea sp.]|nr:hypothetical protein [Mobilitalea sp.]